MIRFHRRVIVIVRANIQFKSAATHEVAACKANEKAVFVDQMVHFAEDVLRETRKVIGK